MNTINVHVSRSIAGGFFGFGVFRAKDIQKSVGGLDTYFAAEGKDWNEFQQNLRHTTNFYAEMVSALFRYDLNLMIEDSNSGLLVSGAKHHALIDWLDKILVGRRPFDGSKSQVIENIKIVYLPFIDSCAILCIPNIDDYILTPEYLQWLIGFGKARISKQWPEDASRIIDQFIGSSN